MKTGNVPKLRFPKFEGDWETKKLEDVGKIRMCKRIFNHETNQVEGIPFFKIGTFGKEPDSFISEEQYKTYKEKFSYPKIGDILISAAGTLGRTVVFDGSPSYFQDSNIVWIDNKEDLITNEFLFYIYKIVKYDSEGGTIQRLYNSIIYNAKFWKPTLPEQTKIANFLTAVDAKISNLSEEKSLLENYKKGVMQKIFPSTGSGIPELRFKQDDGSDFPEWKMKRLGEAGTFVGGGTPRKDDPETWRGEIPWVSSSDLSENNIHSISITRFINNESVLNSATKIIPENSVLFISRVGVGKLAINKVQLCTSQDFTNFTPFRSNSYFIGYYFISHKTKLLNLCQGTSIKGFTTGDLKNFKVVLPTIEEQTKIANFLTSIDEKINTVVEAIENAQTFKKGLLQQLFV